MKIRKAILEKACEDYPHITKLAEDLGPDVGLSIDSRTIGRGDVFFALPGKAFDGHDFINDALHKGAAIVIADQAKISHS